MAEVGELLEALARVAPPAPVRSLRDGTRAQALRFARTCYDHLAGRVGVAMMDALLRRGFLEAARAAGAPAGGDRPAVRYCLDWSEQRPHLARSAWGDPASWSFARCADGVAGFCDALGIARPVVYGHSLGGFVAMAYAARHPGHAGALVLQSTMSRFDLGRPVEGFRRPGDRRRPSRRAAGGGRGAGHFTWKDAPERYWPLLTEVVTTAARTG